MTLVAIRSRYGASNGLEGGPSAAVDRSDDCNRSVDADLDMSFVVMKLCGSRVMVLCFICSEGRLFRSSIDFREEI